MYALSLPQQFLYFIKHALGLWIHRRASNTYCPQQFITSPHAGEGLLWLINPEANGTQPEIRVGKVALPFRVPRIRGDQTLGHLKTLTIRTTRPCEVALGHQDFPDLNVAL